MAEPSYLSGRSFSLDSLCSFVFRIEQWLNLETISENGRLWFIAVSTLVSHFGQGFLCKYILSKMSLVSESIGRKKTTMYIVRKP